jgi:hypothetical protein
MEEVDGVKELRHASIDEAEVVSHPPAATHDPRYVCARVCVHVYVCVHLHMCVYVRVRACGVRTRARRTQTGG